jgi:autotransporter-associated beta strand protein
LGSGNVTVSGGTLNLGTASITNTLGALTGGGAVNNGTITNNSGTYDVQSGSIGAILAGSNGLSKSTAGNVTLSGANTYSGNTTISAGTLALGASGSFANSPVINLGTSGSPGTLNLTAKGSAFAFSTSQTVSGYGTINIGTGNTVTINGTLAPGNSPGITSVIGNLTMAPTTVTNMEIISRTGAAGTAFDQVSVTGALTFDGSLFINTTGLTGLVASDSFFLFNAGSYGAAGLDSVSISGTVYNPGPLAGALGIWTVNDTANNLTFTFTESTGYLAVTAIPEPSAFAVFGGFGALGLVLYRRRRSRV